MRVVLLAVLAAGLTGCLGTKRPGLASHGKGRGLPAACLPAGDCPLDNCAGARAPVVELDSGPVLHVTAPAQKVVVKLPAGLNGPPAGPATAACPPAVPPPCAGTTQQGPPPGYYGHPATSVAQAGAPMNVITSTTQSVGRPKPRLGLVLGICRLPIPYPQIVALPSEQVVTTHQTHQFVPGSPVIAGPPPGVHLGPPSYGPQPYYAPPPCPTPPAACPPSGPLPVGVTVTTFQETTTRLPVAAPVPPGRLREPVVCPDPCPPDGPLAPLAPTAPAVPAPVPQPLLLPLAP